MFFLKDRNNNKVSTIKLHREPEVLPYPVLTEDRDRRATPLFKGPVLSSTDGDTTLVGASQALQKRDEAVPGHSANTRLSSLRQIFQPDCQSHVRSGRAAPQSGPCANSVSDKDGSSLTLRRKPVTALKARMSAHSYGTGSKQL